MNIVFASHPLSAMWTYYGILGALAVISGISMLMNQSKMKREDEENRRKWNAMSSAQRIESVLNVARQIRKLDDICMRSLTDEEKKEAIRRWKDENDPSKKSIEEIAKEFENMHNDIQNAESEARDARAIDRERGIYRKNSAYGL